MNEFEKMIEAKRREHDQKRLETVFGGLKPKVRALGPSHNRPICEQDADGNLYGSHISYEIQRRNNLIIQHLGTEEYYRFNYMGAIMDNIIGFIAASIVDLVLESNIHLHGWDESMQKMLEKLNYLHGKYSVEGENFIDAVKSLRYHWFKDNRADKNVKEVKKAYLAAIKKTKKINDNNFMDLIAWAYTGASLFLEEGRHATYLTETYNKKAKKGEGKLVFQPLRYQCAYGVYEALKGFIHLCGFKDDMTSDAIEAARDEMLAKMKCAPIKAYFDEEKNKPVIKKKGERKRG